MPLISGKGPFHARSQPSAPTRSSLVLGYLGSGMLIPTSLSRMHTRSPSPSVTRSSPVSKTWTAAVQDRSPSSFAWPAVTDDGEKSHPSEHSVSEFGRESSFRQYFLTTSGGPARFAQGGRWKAYGEDDEDDYDSWSGSNICEDGASTDSDVSNPEWHADRQGQGSPDLFP
ncbi:hypothetical protein B0H14DRAFT_2563338 [Mycena olivaceomarginata]|nr:hypothetical protein B0H14DRAFT_2563338 [Mycena olivaceomarginata]